MVVILVRTSVGLLAEHLLLEQGLRLTDEWYAGLVAVLAEHLPLEQGLRPLR